MSEKTKIQLSETVREQIDQWLKNYPQEQKRSAVTESLKFAQAAHGGWLSTDVMDAVAEYLGLPNIAVYEVATFYDMYHLEPVGRHVIDVCTNISCMLAGCDKIVNHLKKRLQIEAHGTTADGKFTLREVECLAACAAAPMFQIGNTYYEHLTPEKVDAILNELE
jgi:NADH-quinone oxidoreductase subunit E